ncbi:MAG: serine/threonine protein kinase [Planctomycetota bacterium]|nr:serine/threonine protein kinase [Planctomycetota bacterium]
MGLLSERANPFEYREPLAHGEDGLQVERAASLRQALELLRRGGFLTVSAPPRTGVSTFLHALRARLACSVYVDLANLSFADEPHREAARMLGRDVKLVRPGLNVPADPFTVADVLGAVADGGKHPEPLTVVVDGFDAWSDESARKLVLALRAAYTESRTRGARAGGFSVITGSSADLRDLTASGRTSPLNLAQHIFLPDFSEAEVADLLGRGFAGQLDAGEVAEWSRHAWHWAAGHPSLTQMIAHQAFEYRAQGVAFADAVRDALPAVRENAADLLGPTLGLLGEREDLRGTASSIYSGQPLPFDRIHRPIRDLQHLGLIRDEHGLCKPRNLVYEQVLAAALNLSAPHSSISLWNARLSSDSIQLAGSLTQTTTGLRDSTGDPTPIEASQTMETPGPRHRPQAAPEPLVAAGTVIGGCRVIKRIGRGAMSEVYLATHLALETDVAIKVLRHPDRNDRRIAQRFLREARAAAQLSHENIVQIRNVGREGELQFIEMEYLAGGSVGDLLKAGPFADMRFAADLLRGAAAGVQCAHKHGVIHRDLKPDNLMITKDGKAKVVDFGLAAVLTLEGSRLTQEGTILGTPHYMAPEQWEGRPVDERSDIYSLGATFYHLLTGKPPFDGKTAVELISNYTHNRLVPPEDFNPSVPRRMSRLLMQMLEKEPDERIANLDDCVHDLRSLGEN